MRDLRRSLEKMKDEMSTVRRQMFFMMQFLQGETDIFGREGDILVRFAFGKMDPWTENIEEPVNY